ncbi:hypothetical protein Dimus_028486 [Dionaea muscipula]
MAKRGRPRRVQPPRTTPVRGSIGRKASVDRSIAIVPSEEVVNESNLIDAMVTQDLTGGDYREIGGKELKPGPSYAWKKKPDPTEVTALQGRGFAHGYTQVQKPTSTDTVRLGSSLNTENEEGWQKVVSRKMGKQPLDPHASFKCEMKPKHGGVLGNDLSN